MSVDTQGNATGVPVGAIDYIAFEGGGGLGLAYPAALQALRDAFEAETDSPKSKAMYDDKGRFQWPIKGVSGSSAGALMAYAVALGYTPREVSDLTIRDGAFGALFREKIKPGWHSATATSPDNTKTKPGWYGDLSKYKKDQDNLNDWLEFQQLKIDPNILKSVEKATKKGLKGLSQKDQRLYDFDRISDLIKHVLSNNNLTSGLPDTYESAFLKTLINALAPFTGLPGSKGSFYKAITSFYSGVLIESIIKFFSFEMRDNSGEHVKIGDAKVSFDQLYNQLVDVINDIATEKLQNNPLLAKMSIGQGDRDRLLLPLSYPIIFILPYIYSLFAPKKRVRGGKKDFLYVEPFAGRLTKEIGLTRERVLESAWLHDVEMDASLRGRDDQGYMRRLLWIFYSRNVFSPANLKGNSLRLLYRAFKLMANGTFSKALGVGKSLGTVEEVSQEDQKAALNKLSIIGVGLLFRVFLTSPIVDMMYKSLLKDGGFLHGETMRDILTLVTINKCYVTKDDQGETVLKKRHATLNDSLASIKIKNATAQLKTYILKQKKGRYAHKTPKYSSGGDGKLSETDLVKVEFRDTLVDQYGIGNISRESFNKKTIKAQMNAIWQAQEMNDPLKRENARRQHQAAYLPIKDQISWIRDELTFEKLFDYSKIDTCITGANVSRSFPVFFRKGLTPDFPVTDAVIMASAFPFLFKQKAVRYRPADPETGKTFSESGNSNLNEVISHFGLSGEYNKRDWFYDTYYTGYFQDAGIFNNLPIHAFNFASPLEANGSKGVVDEKALPQEMMTRPLNPNIIGFELTNEDLAESIHPNRAYRPPLNIFTDAPEKYSENFYSVNGRHRNLSGVLGGLEGAFYGASGHLRHIEPQTQKAILPIITGNMGLFDMIPDTQAIFDVYRINHKRIYHGLTGTALDRKQAEKAMAYTYGMVLNKAAPGLDLERARRARAGWKNNRDSRKILSGMDEDIFSNILPKGLSR